MFCGRMKYLFVIVVSVWAVLLSSCIEGEEKIVIRKDGSTHLKMRYQVPGVIFSAKDGQELVEILDKELGHQEHLTLVTNQVTLERGVRIISIEIDTEPGADLNGLLESPNDEGEEEGKSSKMLHALIGDISTQVDGLSVGVVRNVNLQPLLDEYVGKNSATLLGDSQFSYTVCLPEPVLETNADEVSADGKVLKWRYRLSDTKKRPISMRLVAAIPIPWWVYTIGGVLVLLVIGGLVAWVKKIRKKSVA